VSWNSIDTACSVLLMLARRPAKESFSYHAEIPCRLKLQPTLQTWRRIILPEQAVPMPGKMLLSQTGQQIVSRANCQNTVC